MDNEDFYVNVAKRGVNIQKKQKKDISRRSLPKIDALMEWGVVSAGDILVAKGRTDEATLLASGQVRTAAGKTESIQKWLKSVFGWSSVETYSFSVHKEKGKTLSELRAEYMEQNED